MLGKIINKSSPLLKNNNLIELLCIYRKQQHNDIYK